MTDAAADNTAPEGADVAEANPADARVIAREDAAFARAAEADERIKTGKHFGDWLAIGEGLAALRDRAMREACSNSPYGKTYTARYAALKKTHPWAGHYDASTISHACWLHDNATDVIRWRETLSSNQREAWTTPKVVHQHYDRLTKPVLKKEATASSAARENNAQTIIRLQEELDLLRKKGGGGLMPSATVDQLTEAIFEAHNPAYVRRLLKVLGDRLEAEERQDKVEASVKAKRKRGAAGAA
jgi:hypothetical protein